MSLTDRLLARLLGLGPAYLNTKRSKLADFFFRLCFVLSVSKFYSIVIEINVWLWNRIRIAGYFPAIIDLF